MSIVFLSVGSNKGNRLNNIKKLINRIKNEGSIEIISISSLYETEPVGYKNQKNFYNLCLKIKSELTPYELLSRVKKTEKELGRKKGVRWGPRVIDIDILFYDNLVLKDEGLQIPHPEIQNRKFVLIPLKEIEPDFICPVSGKGISELLNETLDSGSVVKLKHKF